MAVSTLHQKVRLKPVRLPSAEHPVEHVSEQVDATKKSGNWSFACGLAVVTILGATIMTLLGAESTAVKAGAVFVAALIELGIASMASR
jgi:hypothetical protein